MAKKRYILLFVYPYELKDVDDVVGSCYGRLMARGSTMVPDYRSRG